MAIKPIDDIPKNLTQQRESYRALIRADIQEAIDKGINKFEFVGDYNYKYLAQYAREEARNILADTIRRRGCKAHWWERAFDNYPYIRIGSVKGEEHRRVFCEIIPENLDKAIEQAKRDNEERYKAVERRRAERGAKNDARTKDTAEVVQ